MANLCKKGDIFVVRFRYAGKEYKRSLKTRSEHDAVIARKLVELTIHRLLTGQLTLQEGVEAGDFIVSGGTLRPPEIIEPPPVFPTTRELIERYLNAKTHVISDNYLASQKIHLNHLTKFLGTTVDGPCHQVTQRLLEKYLTGRLAIRDAQTVSRERVTLLQFYKWVSTRQDVPSFPSPIMSLPTFKTSKDRDRFRTASEIEEVIKRGGLTDEEAANAWDCLYLSPEEIADLLATVRVNARARSSLMLHAIPAYTGMRRGEVMQLPWADVDLDRGYIIARSRKQSRTNRETTRQIDLHPELKQLLIQGRHECRRGQLVIGDAETLRQLNPDEANRLFWQPMRKTAWCLNSSRNWFKIGFHTYRHSFASNLACRGVDQRIIDKWMGHQTEEMRKRYQHLFPRHTRSAIECFSLVAKSGEPCPT